MGSSKSSSNANYDYSIKDYSTNQNFENVGKVLSGNAVDSSTTNTTYNFGASDKAMQDLGSVLLQQSAQTSSAVAQTAQTQKAVTNEIVNSIQSTAKTNTVMIAAVAGTALVGGAYFLSKRKK
jgi:uncharacterized protein YaaQ